MSKAETARRKGASTQDRPPRKFEDLTIGETRVSHSFTVSEAEIIGFAQQYDPQWFHVDPDEAVHSHFGEIVASGVHVLAVWRQLDHAINSDIDFVCGIGFDELRLKAALRPGDTVYATSKITTLTPSMSGKPRGTAVTYYELINQDGAIIVQFNSINLVSTRSAAS